MSDQNRPTYNIPVIDLAPFLNGAPGAAERTAKRLRWIQEEVGFYYTINHGIPSALIKAAHDQVEAFHSQPLKDKLAIKVDEKSTGYVPFKSTVYVTSKVAENKRKDLNENIRIVRERPVDHPGIMSGRPFTGPNKWPEHEKLTNFKPVMLEYFRAMEDLGHAMLPLYAMALGLPHDYFNDLFTDPCWISRNVHYPPVDAEEGQFGIAPHTDHGFITLLPINEVPGLQVQARDGVWISAGYIENAIIVNSGDFMAKWTNGRFRATPHRVLPPTKDRYISALFYNPNWDVSSAPLPGCNGPAHQPPSEITTMLDHLCAYVNSNYAQSAGGMQDDQGFS